MPRPDVIVSTNYPALLEEIKSRIYSAQIKAALSVNRELIELYWDIGKPITARQKKRAGENQWLNAFLLISEMNFLKSPAFRRETFGECGPFTLPGPRKSEN